MSPPSRLRPLLILGAALLVVVVLALIGEEPAERPAMDTSPLVRVVEAQPRPHRFIVTANGSVSPRAESDLIPQVSGEVVEMSPALVPGGYFDEGDVLARIDDADYHVERAAARAQVARAHSEFGRARKELDRQRRLADRSVASQARIDDAENAFRIAEAVLQEAEARLERAERDLARTTIRAPYRGLVRSEQVDIGQFVTRGSPIARIYAADAAEIRLPVPDRELAYLDLERLQQQIAAREGHAASGPRVTLRADFAGHSHEWDGQLVRTEAELDPRSRMVLLVARVPDPFGLDRERSAPLAIGLFVDAEIEGRTLERAFVLPREALRADDRVFVVNEQGQLHFREIELLRATRDEIVVASGLEPGDRVCTSTLDAAIDGMQVRVAPEAVR
jgi:RND family efflux transporter MFP subunit